MFITKCHLSSLGLAAIMACAIPVVAQDLQAIIQAETNVDIDTIDSDALPPTQSHPERTITAPRRTAENQYRIGIDCRPVSPALKSHLHLDEDTGLMVHMVMPGSSGALAGLRQYDVIVEAEGHHVGEINDLVKHVNAAQENEMTLNIIREGEEHVLKVTPEKRNADEMAQLRNGFRKRLGAQGLGPQGMGKEFDEIFRRFQDPNGMGFRIRPAVPMPNMPQVPNSFNLRIERNNDKIVVQRGNDRYEVTTDTLDQLPDDIRPMVENMMNGQNLFGGMFAPGTLPNNLRPLPAPQAPSGGTGDLQDRFDGINLQLQELKDAIRSMEKK